MHTTNYYKNTYIGVGYPTFIIFSLKSWCLWCFKCPNLNSYNLDIVNHVQSHCSIFYPLWGAVVSRPNSAHSKTVPPYWVWHICIIFREYKLWPYFLNIFCDKYNRNHYILFLEVMTIVLFISSNIQPNTLVIRASCMWEFPHHCSNEHLNSEVFQQNRQRPNPKNNFVANAGYVILSKYRRTESESHQPQNYYFFMYFIPGENSTENGWL